jgi:LysR family transcriptional activator of nhaA
MVGVADVVPKLVARRLLEPALKLGQPVRLVCHEDKPDRLLAELAVHELDVVLSDAPVSPSLNLRAFSHLLGECGVVFLATPELA